MEKHLEEDYPELLKLLRVECKGWSFYPFEKDTLDENIEKMLGETAWGLLKLFETKLVELKDLDDHKPEKFDDVFNRCLKLARKLNIKKEELDRRSEELDRKKETNTITAMRCPFNPEIGCDNGKTGILEEVFEDDNQGTVFRESGVRCAAWSLGGDCCLRLYHD